MRLLSEILLSPVTGPLRTVDFVVKRVKDQVEAEFLDEGKVRAELLDLSLKRTRGEIDDEQYKEQEAAILEHLNVIREYKRSAEGAPVEQGDEAANDGEDS